MIRQDPYEKIVDYIIKNQNKFYRLAFSYVQNPEDALDAVQSAVCKALEHSSDLKNKNAVKTWFYQILVNECLLLLKEKRKFPLMGEAEPEEIPYEEQEMEPKEDLYSHINRLEEDVQTIIKLRFYQELSLKEIAEILEMNLNTVKAKLYRGLKTLKVAIQEVDV